MEENEVNHASNLDLFIFYKVNHERLDVRFGKKIKVSF